MVDAATIQHYEQQAEHRGELRGKESILLRQISKRFGSASTDLISRLDRLNADQLDELGEALLDLTSRSEIDAWLNSRLKA